MAHCNSCAAPLPADTNRCTYCNVRNDVDLQSKGKYTVKTRHSDRICPHCEIPLQTIKLNANTPLYLERCKTCFGVFFDPEEIEIFLESSVSNVFETNLKLIKNINKDRYKKKQAVKYIKCPICRILMNRVNFAHRSGVVIDRCKKHGIWLDSGEITHLLEWKKAGGELLHSKNQEKARKKTSKPTISYDRSSYPQHTNHQETELFDSISKLVFGLFS
jgi:Zn-finger nucleic acid-binding protein